MLRSAAIVVASLFCAVEAGAAPARAPVTVYLIAPNDRPDKTTILTARSPETREVKHVASTWGGELAMYLHVAPDCAATDLTTTVVTPPAHGRLVLVDGFVPPLKYIVASLPKGDLRAACPRLSARHVIYRPDSDFVGHDRVAVAFTEGDASFTDDIDIIVRRADRPNPLAPDR